MKFHSITNSNGYSDINIELLKSFSCCDCEFETRSKKELKNHRDEFHAQIAVHRCPHCNFRTSNAPYLPKHIESRHRRVEKKQKQNKSTNIKCDSHPAWAENIDQNSMQNVLAIQQDFQIATHLRCLHCNDIFSTKCDLQTHIAKIHTPGLVSVNFDDICNTDQPLASKVNKEANVKKIENSSINDYIEQNEHFSSITTFDFQTLHNGMGEKTVSTKVRKSEDHLTNTMSSISECKLCSFKATSQHTLTQHVDYAHNDIFEWCKSLNDNQDLQRSQEQTKTIEPKIFALINSEHSTIENVETKFKSANLKTNKSHSVFPRSAAIDNQEAHSRSKANMKDQSWSEFLENWNKKNIEKTDSLETIGKISLHCKGSKEEILTQFEQASTNKEKTSGNSIPECSNWFKIPNKNSTRHPVVAIDDANRPVIINKASTVIFATSENRDMQDLIFNEHMFKDILSHQRNKVVSQIREDAKNDTKQYGNHFVLNLNKNEVSSKRTL